MKRIMIIAGGTWQVPLIRRAKNLGYEVVNTNLYEDSIGFKFSDYTSVADVRDKEKNLEIAKRYKIDAVLTDQSDIAVPTVAYVAEKMGCPTIGLEKAELFTNKYKMREFCKQMGFQMPEYCLCETKEEAIVFINSLKRKVIIKPLDSQSSRGVYVINDVTELDEKFEIAKQFTKNQKYVLVERYIQGTEFTIDGVVERGIHHSMAISEKSHFSYNSNIANRLFFTYSNSKFDYEKLRNLNDSLINATELPFGLTHAEYKFEDGNYFLIEMAARGGGTKIASDIAPYVSGVDSYKLLIENALGVNSDTIIGYNTIASYKNRSAVLEFLDVESKGKQVKKIEGVEEIRKIPEVVNFELEFTVGDVVKKADDDRSRVGFFIVCAESKEKVIQISQKIKTIFKISFR